MSHAIRVVALVLSALAWPHRAVEGQRRTDGFVQTADGVRLYYRVVGRGPDTIVAVHGGPGETLATLEPGLAPLTRIHAVLFYDQRGNGRSTRITDSTRLRVEDHVADLAALRSRLRLDPAPLLGHSWGANLVALYAARHPNRVSRLILVDPGPPRQLPYGVEANRRRMAGFDSASLDRVQKLASAAIADTARDRARICRDFYGLYLRNYFTRAAARSQLITAECDYEYSMSQANLVSRYTMGPQEGRAWDTLVTRVTIPVLVIHGTDDFIPVSSSERWARAFPDARLLLIPDARHFPFADNPEAFFPAAEAFLKGRWPAGAVRPQRR